MISNLAFISYGHFPKMKGSLILVITLFCYFQSVSEVSSFTLESELNQELASIIKDDLAQGPIINL